MPKSKRIRHSPDVDWAGISEYVREIRNQLGLSEWAVHIMHTPCDSQYQASIAPVYGRYHASLSLCWNWGTLTPEIQRETIVHELLHLRLLPVDSAFDHIKQALSKRHRAAAESAHIQSIEFAVDGIACAIAPFYPLPFTSVVSSSEENDAHPVNS